MPILVTANRDVPVDYAAALTRVRAREGVGLMRQSAQLLRLGFGPGRIQASDYFLFGLYRKSLTAQEKREYASVRGLTALNAWLCGGDHGPHRNAIEDKLYTAALLRGAGIATPEIMGLYCPGPAPGGWPVLRDAAAIAAFLRSIALPVFGKPRDGSMGLGVMSLFERSGDGRTGVMGDGREIVIDELAAEIAGRYRNGYLFQPFVRNHPDLAVYGPNVAQTLRVVTFMGERDAEALYVNWRVPGKKALSDNNSTAGRVLTTAIDLDAATAGRGRGYAIDDNPFDGFSVHPDLEMPIEGVRIPELDKVLAVALDGQRLFDRHAILGWDVVLGPDGPVVLEANANPLHYGYQLAHRRGFWNADIRQRLAPVIARAKGHGPWGKTA